MKPVSYKPQEIGSGDAGRYPYGREMKPIGASQSHVMKYKFISSDCTGL